MNIIASAKMGKGTFEAKFIPLSKVSKVKNIFVIRKKPGPKIDKIKYIILPKILRYKFLNMLITPFILAHYSRKLKADIILSYHFVPHTIIAFIAASLTKRPFTFSQTGLFIQKYAKMKLLRPFILQIIKKAKYINVPGKNTKQFWERQGISTSKINLLHSTIDTDLFIPQNEKKEYDFIFIGRLNYIKQIHLLIDAFSKINQRFPEAKFAIVGDGPEKTNLEKYSKRLSLSTDINFLGFQSDTKTLLQKSRIFLMASKSEGLPCALMEAMSCGLIAISTDVGNISDIIINGRTGFVYEYGDSENLISLMEYTYIHSNKLDSIKKNARAIIVEEHSQTMAIDLWSELLEKINPSILK